MAGHPDRALVLPTPDDVSPVRAGRFTRIRALDPRMYEWLYHIAVHSPAGSRWRLHGEIPSFEEFVGGMLRDARATFVVYSLDDRPLGLVQLTNVDQVSRYGHVTAFLDPAVERKGWPLEGVALFFDYVFKAFDLRKLYFETLATELVAFGSLVGGLLREEGCLRDHRYVHGVYVDCHVLALYRTDFDAVAGDWLARPPR